MTSIRVSEERIKINLVNLFADELEFILGGLKFLTIDILVIEGDHGKVAKKQTRLSHSTLRELYQEAPAQRV